MIRSNLFYLIGTILLAILTACTPVGPDYIQPSTRMPGEWSSSDKHFTTSSSISQWWTLFKAPLLDSLIKRAAASNQDLRIAEARVREARAQQIIAASSLSVDTSLAATRSKKSNNTTSTSSKKTQNLFEAGFDAGWEIDIFGGQRRAKEAAEATLAATQEDLRAALVSLESEVARNYLVLCASRQRLKVARENITTQKKTVDLILGRYRLGLGNELDLANARTELAMTQSQVPAMQITIKEAMRQLAILLGRQPQNLVAELARSSDIPSVPVKIPVRLPSELLRQRPDIRAAERRLAAATAQIGVATADLFPRFSLTALLGLQSVNLSDLVTSGSRYWSIGPTLNLSLFDDGKARAEVEIRKAQRDSALALYEKTVLGAIADVENALTSFSHEKEARQCLVEAVASGKKALAIADGLYQSGLTDFLHVLQSEHALYQSQDQLVQSNQRLALDVVAIFKALGGGWKLKEAPVSPPRSVGAKNSKQQNRQ
jgi:NodT family efflux transporter outer membrane factor (OMF) lipoprotein